MPRPRRLWSRCFAVRRRSSVRARRAGRLVERTLVRPRAHRRQRWLVEIRALMTRIVVEEIGRRLRIVSDYPFQPSEMSRKSSAPPVSEGLRPGQLVQIRARNEIGRTLDEKGKNRGLWFDREMVPYCGQTARVKAKVDRFIDEGSGRVVELASDCYILDNVVCQSYRSSGAGSARVRFTRGGARRGSNPSSKKSQPPRQKPPQAEFPSRRPADSRSSPPAASKEHSFDSTHGGPDLGVVATTLLKDGLDLCAMKQEEFRVGEPGGLR